MPASVALLDGAARSVSFVAVAMQRLSSPPGAEPSEADDLVLEGG